MSLAVPAGVHAKDDIDDLEHLIPPGYTPQTESDEKGLWNEFEEIELQMNKSAMLVRDPDINNYLNRVVCRVVGPYCNTRTSATRSAPGPPAPTPVPPATGAVVRWPSLTPTCCWVESPPSISRRSSGRTAIKHSMSMWSGRDLQRWRKRYRPTAFPR